MGEQGLKRRSARVAFAPADVAAAAGEERAGTAIHSRAAPALSLLRMSVPGRLAIVAVVAAFLWAAVIWALS
jgi:hypothetical protein